MNKTLKDMLIGVLLGDAHIGRTGLNKAFISFEQSSKKTDYLNYLFNINTVNYFLASRRKPASGVL